jgi:DNA invertase Pin-like site-specific DNA recombinase
LVTRLDRLARSTRDLLNTLDAIAKAGGAFGLSRMRGPTPPLRMES